MTNIRNALIQSAGSAGGDKVYVEEVFSTSLYDGNDGSQTITNGIDLSGEGGLVWIKERSGAGSEGHRLIDTVRGATKMLQSNAGTVENTIDGGFNAFTSTGFTLKADNGWAINSASPARYASWSFRKQEGFFQVVSWTGSNDSSTDIGKGIVAHNLGCKPGMVIIKNTVQASTDWIVWHKGLASGHYIKLNTTAAATNSGSVAYFSKYDGGWSQTDPDATNIYVGYNYQTNSNSEAMIAYVFADGAESDAQIFGEDGNEAIVKCGTWTASSGNGTVTLGFEPQWVLVKCASGTGSWLMFDNMRGMSIGTDDAYLVANSAGAEGTGTDFININATGFTVSNLGASQNFIYIAIRRGPMKEPEAGTDVFSIAQPTTTAPLYKTGKLVDMAFNRQVHSAADLYLQTRLAAKQFLRTNTTDAAQSDSSAVFDYQTGYYNGSWNDTNAYGWAFRRFPKVFDVIARTGTGGGGVSVPHNLTVVPELVISKTLTASGFGTDLDKWFVWSSAISGSGNDTFVQLQSDTGGSGLQMGFFSSSPTASAMTVHGNINYSGDDLTYFLFASLSGISAVNKYTGTGNDINVTDLGAAARFVMIKRTDNTGDWYVYDSTRGIVSGNDPYIFMNTQAAQVTNTDYIDAHASGFTITSSAPDALNASGGEYLYLAFS